MLYGAHDWASVLMFRRQFGPQTTEEQKQPIFSSLAKSREITVERSKQDSSSHGWQTLHSLLRMTVSNNCRLLSLTDLWCDYV